MQIVETLNEGLKRAFTITIPAGEVEAKVDQQIRKMAPTIRMPGFRPGKVPPNLVRKMHGEALHGEALGDAVRGAVEKMIVEKKLRPAMQPEVALGEDYAPGKDAEVKVTLEALPDLPAPNIAGIKLDRYVVSATDEEIEAQLSQLAGQQRTFEPAPDGHKAAQGDQVVIDFEGSTDGTPFPGGTGQDMPVVLGSGSLIPGFEDGLVGVSVGEEKVLALRFPDDYSAEHLKGKDAEFKVTVKAVNSGGEVKADDEFAKSLGLSGIDQLRDLVRGQIEQEHNGLTRTHMKRKLLDELAARHDFAVPQAMVEAEFEQIWQQLQHEASHEADPGAARAEMERERDDYRRIAERRVRLGLLLSEIGNANGINVNQAEMQRLIAQAAQGYRREDQDKFIKYVQDTPMAQAQLRAPLFEDKVVDFLFSQAEVTEKRTSKEALQREIEADDTGHVHGPGCGHDHEHGAAETADAGSATNVAPAAKPKRAKKPKAEEGGGTAVEAAAAAGEAAEAALKARKPRAKKAASE